MKLRNTLSYRIGGHCAIFDYVTPLLDWAVEMLCKRLSTTPYEIPDSMRAPFIRIIELPEWLYGSKHDIIEFSQTFPKKMILDYKVNCAVTVFDEKPWLRVCGNIYNTKEDYTRLGDAILAYYSFENPTVNK